MEPSPRVTIRDVAAVAGVSIATVSKVVNSRYGVSAATFARVQAVIAELGYEAAPVGYAPGVRRTNVIGVLVADLEPYSTEVLKGVAEALRHSGFDLVVYSAAGRTTDHRGWERRYLSRLVGTPMDGAILVTPTVVEAPYTTPIVVIDPNTRSGGLPSFDVDNAHGARLATEHLIALGHRRVALLAGRPDLRSARQREDGYRQAMAAAGLPVDPDLVRLGDYDPDVSADAARWLLGKADPPTAIVAANDLGALATIRVARELGLRVPRDLSVVGFDDIPDAALCDPPLTTVEQPIQQLGRLATEALLQLVRGEPVAGGATLPSRLVVRRSTGPVPTATRL